MESNDLIFNPNIDEDKEFVPQKYAIEQPPSSFAHTQTGYMYFLEDNREKILKNDELKFKSQKEFKAYLLKLWDNLNETEKSKYNLKANQDKIRFETVLESKPDTQTTN